VIRIAIVPITRALTGVSADWATLTENYTAGLSFDSGRNNCGAPHPALTSKFEDRVFATSVRRIFSVGQLELPVFALYLQRLKNCRIHHNRILLSEHLHHGHTGVETRNPA
jgi:hypothetical protein